MSSVKMMKCVIGGGAALLAVGLGAGRPAHALELTAHWQKPNKGVGSFQLPQGGWQQRAMVQASNGTWSVLFPLHKYDHANTSSSHWRNLGAYLQTSPEKKYTKPEWSQKVAAVEKWLFHKDYVMTDDGSYLQSQLGSRNQKDQAPKRMFRDQFAGSPWPNVAVAQGSITGFAAEAGESAAVLDSNNGDLFTGCGYAVAKAVVNAAGPGLQAELYNRFGIPGYMRTTKYGRSFYSQTEGRGYSVTCGGHDMRRSHGIDAIELATAPMKSREGLVNMFFEAFENSAKRDYLAVPLAGASHSVVQNQQNPVEFHAKVILEAYQKFRSQNPTSQLKVLFVIYNAKKKQEFQDRLQKCWYSYFPSQPQPAQQLQPGNFGAFSQGQLQQPGMHQSNGVPQQGLVGNPYIKPNTQYPQTVTNHNSQNQYQPVQFAYESQNKFSNSTKALITYVLRTRSIGELHRQVSVCGNRPGIWQVSGSCWMCIQENTCTQAMVGQWCDVKGYWAGSPSKFRSVRIQIGNAPTPYENSRITDSGYY